MGRRSDIMPLPSLERLNELFVYEPSTGILRWRNVPNNFKRAKPGDVVGTIGWQGYRLVGVDRKQYQAHRIIWKMMTGEDPADQVDHEDGDRQNNRWTNLRAATNGPNIQNAKLRKDNKSGVKGVCWDGHHKAWKVYISAGKGQKRLGRFKSLEEAAAVRRNAAEKLHGDFARSA
jgi:hypothetical protein